MGISTSSLMYCGMRCFYAVSVMKVSFFLQATGIWLLALLKHCPNREPIKQRLDALQKTFMDLLSENNGNS